MKSLTAVKARAWSVRMAYSAFSHGTVLGTVLRTVLGEDIHMLDMCVVGWVG